MTADVDLAEQVRALAARTVPRQSRSWWTKTDADCDRRECQCTHTTPCYRGWLEMPPEHINGIDYERVAPCPVCRFEAATRYEQHLRQNSKDHA